VAIGERYRVSSKRERERILDEFVAVTGYHRKHSIRLLNEPVSAKNARSGTPRLRVYDAAVRNAVIVLWEASDRVCGKRLKPLLPLLVDSLERHGHLALDATVRVKILGASAATLDRLLAEPRSQTDDRRSRSRAATSLRGSVPVRTFSDWKDPLPGFMEADLVAHCGGLGSGSFVHTLTLTDVATGWTECVALPIRESSLIVKALSVLRTAVPFPLRGIDTDNGSEFMNELVIDYCKSSGLELTRSRPYRKNDQAWVEQKNGSVVRRLVGYRRLEGLAATEALARLYASSRLFVNFFQPSFKLAEKIRVGARVKKRYHAPETPSARVLQADSVSEATKEHLRHAAGMLDPLRLLDEIRAMQTHLAGFAVGAPQLVVPQRDADLDRFMMGLATAWHRGEVRPTHQKEPKAARHWRTRVDPFEAVWPRVIVWLESEPDRTAKEMLERLQADAPGSYLDGQLRTLQRRVHEWRSAFTRRLMFGTDLGASSEPSLDAFTR
jgi:hypothetical protein